MAVPRPPVIVVDTNVFGADLVRRGAPLATLYRPYLEGRSFVLSFQTVAELRFGALRKGWGAARLPAVGRTAQPDGGGVGRAGTARRLRGPARTGGSRRPQYGWGSR